MKPVCPTLSVSLALLLVACSGEDVDDEDSEAGCQDVLAHLDEEGRIAITLSDAMNYAFQSTIEAQTIRVQANSDIQFDWSEVTKDMLGRDLDAVLDVDMLEVFLWEYDQDEFLQDINDETLDLSKLIALGYCDNTKNATSSCWFLDVLPPAGSEQTEETLLEFVNPELYPPSEHIYVAMLAQGAVFGQGTLMLAFFEVDPSESNQEVHLTNDSTNLDYTADLTSLTPISIPSATASVVLNWGDSNQLTTNAMGADWIATRITDVIVAHYQDLTVSDLEEQFLDLESLADDFYTVRITAGQKVELAQLTDQDGVTFPGIDDTGVWIIGFTCSTCRNPAPWFLSVLSPCD